MRIAIMTDSYLPTRDGVVTAVMTLSKSLRDLGHTVFIIAPDPGEGQREQGVYYFPAMKFRKYPDYFLPIFPSGKRGLIESLDVDIIHIHGVAFMAIKGLMVSRATGIPAVATYCTNVVDTLEFYSPMPMPADIQSKLAWIYMRNFLKRPKCVIALTPATLTEFKENSVRTKRTEVIPVGIDVNRFRLELDGSEIRKRHGLTDEKVVIHVGRVSFEKNIGVPIKAVKHLPENIKLMIVGKGPAFQEMKDLVKAEGLEHRVIFTGFVPDDELPLYYSAADIVVSASRFETQGLTIAEAMACGIPAACSDGRAFLDVVEEGVNGYFFKDTPEQCAGAIMKCLENKDRIAPNARRTAEEYSMEVVGRKITTLYEEIIREGSLVTKNRNFEL
ncbi:MAG: glycosyltransferase [Candidatus Methanoplasma sp.]|jgi:1,2-diacylglycerol 3-alpha-glucosyltransferase|nr:glycosyltransferase [Candidatus Methanoplasma sp.]